MPTDWLIRTVGETPDGAYAAIKKRSSFAFIFDLVFTSTLTDSLNILLFTLSKPWQAH